MSVETGSPRLYTLEIIGYPYPVVSGTRKILVQWVKDYIARLEPEQEIPKFRLVLRENGKTCKFPVV